MKAAKYGEEKKKKVMAQSGGNEKNNVAKNRIRRRQ